MTIFQLGLLLALFVGFVIGRRTARPVIIADGADVMLLRQTHHAAHVALTAAQNDGATLARMSWERAGRLALGNGRIKALPPGWDTLTPDTREGVYRIAAASVLVVAEDAAERMRRREAGMSDATRVDLDMLRRLTQYAKGFDRDVLDDAIAEIEAARAARLVAYRCAALSGLLASYDENVTTTPDVDARIVETAAHAMLAAVDATKLSLLRGLARGAQPGTVAADVLAWAVATIAREPQS